MTPPPRSVPPFVRVLAAFVGTLAVLAVQIIAPSPASAHAQLESTSPKDGATLTAAPPEVELRFNEQVNPDLSQVSVTSGSTTVSQGSPEIDGDTVRQGVDSGMEAGEYTVTYKVVSADGHPVSGTVSFTYAPAAEEEQEGAGSDSATGTDSPTPTDQEPSEETSGDDTGSAAGDGSQTSAEGSETSESTSTAGADPASGEGDGSSGLPAWAWGAVAAGVLLVLGAVTLLTRGRGKASEEEEIALEDWRE